MDVMDRPRVATTKIVSIWAEHSINFCEGLRAWDEPSTAEANAAKRVHGSPMNHTACAVQCAASFEAVGNTLACQTNGIFTGSAKRDYGLWSVYFEENLESWDNYTIY